MLVGIVIVIIVGIAGAIAIPYILPKTMDDCIEVLENNGFTVVSAYWDIIPDLISDMDPEGEVSYIEIETLDQFVEFADTAYEFYIAYNLEDSFYIWSDSLNNVLFFYIFDVYWHEGSYIHLGLVEDIDESIVYYGPK